MKHWPNHIYFISMGHRNNGRGGATGEYAWTPGVARELDRQLKLVGAKPYLTQEHDGDSDPNYTNMSLGGASRVPVHMHNRFGAANALLSIHYGGEPVPGAFMIPPDSGGLRNGGTGQPVHGDAWADNAVDIRLCRNIIDEIRKTNTMRIRTGGGVREPGILSERATGVGASNWRLAELQETIAIRATTARVITEAGNYLNATDRALLQSPAWIRNHYVPAIIRALRLTFGAFPNDSGAGGGGTPPVNPPSGNPSARIIEETKSGDAFIRLSNGATLFRAGEKDKPVRVKAIRSTPRLQYAYPDSPRLGANIWAGQEFEVAYLIVNSDRSLYWYTKYGTRVIWADTVPV